MHPIHIPCTYTYLYPHLYPFPPTHSVAGSLMPGPPPTKKYGENKQLTFLASLLSGTVDDKDRRFVISFYVMDNTLKV